MNYTFLIDFCDFIECFKMHFFMNNWHILKPLPSSRDPSFFLIILFSGFKTGSSVDIDLFNIVYGGHVGQLGKVDLTDPVGQVGPVDKVDLTGPVGQLGQVSQVD